MVCCLVEILLLRPNETALALERVYKPVYQNISEFSCADYTRFCTYSIHGEQGEFIEYVR